MSVHASAPLGGKVNVNNASRRKRSKERRKTSGGHHRVNPKNVHPGYKNTSKQVRGAGAMNSMSKNRRRGHNHRAPSLRFTPGSTYYSPYVRMSLCEEMEMVLKGWMKSSNRIKYDTPEKEDPIDQTAGKLLNWIKGDTEPTARQIEALVEDYGIMYYKLTGHDPEVIHRILVDECNVFFVKCGKNHPWLSYNMGRKVVTCALSEITNVLKGQGELVYKTKGTRSQKVKSLKTLDFFEEKETRVDWEVNQILWEMYDLLKKMPPSYTRVSVASFFYGGFNVNGWLKQNSTNQTMSLHDYYSFLMGDAKEVEDAFTKLKKMSNSAEILHHMVQITGDVNRGKPFAAKSLRVNKAVGDVDALCESILEKSKVDVCVYGITDVKYTHHKSEDYQPKITCFSPVSYDVLKQSEGVLYHVNSFRISVADVSCLATIDADPDKFAESTSRVDLATVMSFPSHQVRGCEQKRNASSLGDKLGCRITFETTCVFDMLGFNRSKCEIRCPKMFKCYKRSTCDDGVGSNVDGERLCENVSKRRRVENTQRFEFEKSIYEMLEEEPPSMGDCPLSSQSDGRWKTPMTKSNTTLVPNELNSIGGDNQPFTTREYRRGIKYDEGKLADLIYVTLSLMFSGKSPSKWREDATAQIKNRDHWKSAIFCITNPVTMQSSFASEDGRLGSGFLKKSTSVILKKDLFRFLTLHGDAADAKDSYKNVMSNSPVLDCAKRVSVYRKEEGWLLDLVRIYRRLLISHDSLDPGAKLKKCVKSALRQGALMNSTYVKYRRGSPIHWVMEMERISVTSGCTGHCKLSEYTSCFNEGIFYSDSVTKEVVSSSSGADDEHNGLTLHDCRVNGACETKKTYQYVAGSGCDFELYTRPPHTCGWSCKVCANSAQKEIIAHREDFHDVGEDYSEDESNWWLFNHYRLYYPEEAIVRDLAWLMKLFRLLSDDMRMQWRKEDADEEHKKNNVTLPVLFQQATKYHYRKLMWEFVDFANMDGCHNDANKKNQEIFYTYLKMMSNPNQTHPVLGIGLLVAALSVANANQGSDNLRTSSGVNVPKTLVGFLLRNYINHVESGQKVHYQVLCLEPSLRVARNGHNIEETMINGGYVVLRIECKYDALIVKENIYPEEVKIYKLCDTRKDKTYTSISPDNDSKESQSTTPGTHVSGKMVSLLKYEEELLNNAASCLEIF